MKTERNSSGNRIYREENVLLEIRQMALEGAIQGIKNTMLSDEIKADLKEFYQGHKKL